MPRDRRHARQGRVKRIAVVIAALLGLAACQEKLTLEQAQALCTKKGGLLVVIYSQKITMAGPGPETASPGDCISPSKFDAANRPAAAPAAAK